MYRIATTFLLAISFVINTVDANIIETQYMNELLNHVTPQTLIIFDIDNTIMRPKQQLGSDQWFQHRKTVHINAGLTKSEALEKALAEWMSVQSVTAVQLAEEQTREIITSLQAQGYTVMGLTTRGLGHATRTILQLGSLNINLATTAPAQEDIFFNNGRGTLFRKGILFTAASDKGTALEKFLHLTNYKPEAIIFINDKASHIAPVERYCQEAGIPFTGLRYGHLDNWVTSFRKDTAAIQWLSFGRILSDQKAEELADMYHRAIK
ncbi:Uncharacterized protein SCG7086_BG_00070 [Chlamydiales bacterium SCGC AG-110-P3]|nr:Uncharacterized protein SCG7086_BG_00070 [Chlamydiales bacterium SCGC AG-110-P3]